MSYDLAIGVKVDGTDKFVKVAYCDPCNPSYNIGKALRTSTGWDFTQGEWYRVVDVVPKIERGIHEMRFNKKAYEDMFQKGYGGYGSVIEALQGILTTTENVSEYNGLPLEHFYVRW